MLSSIQPWDRGQTGITAMLSGPESIRRTELGHTVTELARAERNLAPTGGRHP